MTILQRWKARRAWSKEYKRLEMASYRMMEFGMDDALRTVEKAMENLGPRP